jgi:hypothetical protein
MQTSGSTAKLATDVAALPQRCAADPPLPVCGLPGVGLVAFAAPGAVVAFLPDLLLFAAAQVAAWTWLHTGRVWLGGGAMVVLWSLADWVVVQRLVYGASAESLAPWSWPLRGVAIVVTCWLLRDLWARRWSRTAKQRPVLFRAGLEAYLRDELEPARQTFTRLVRSDPCDTAAWIALGSVLARSGRPRRARRCFRRARAVDRQAEHGHLLDLQERRFASRPKADDAVDGPRA